MYTDGPLGHSMALGNSGQYIPQVLQSKVALCMVAHPFNISTWMAGAGGPLSSRPFWYTQRAPGQPGVGRESQSQNNRTNESLSHTEASPFSFFFRDPLCISVSYVRNPALSYSSRPWDTPRLTGLTPPTYTYPTPPSSGKLSKVFLFVVL